MRSDSKYNSATAITPKKEKKKIFSSSKLGHNQRGKVQIPPLLNWPAQNIKYYRKIMRGNIRCDNFRNLP